MPRHQTIVDEVSERAANPPGLSGQAGEAGDLTVGGDAPGWDAHDGAVDAFVGIAWGHYAAG